MKEELDLIVKDFDLDKWEEDEELSIKYSKEVINRVREYIDPILPENYDIKIVNYKYKDKSKKYWDVCKIVILKDGKELTHVNRNYNFTSDNFAYVKQGDKEYLITSGDYQTFCIVDLHTGNIKVHYAGQIKIGGGWCPTDIEWDEDYNDLRIEGCIWGGDFGTLYIGEIDDLWNLEVTRDRYKIFYEDDDTDDEESDDE